MKEDLRRELMEMASADQEALLARDRERFTRIQTANLRRLRKIVDDHRWPGRPLVGEDGADAAWLVLQHADSPDAFEFRRRCLQLLEQGVARGEVDPRHVAYISDRIAMIEGLHLHGVPGVQEFGTQVGSYSNEAGSEAPLPAADAVDQNRRDVLLPPRSAIDLEARPHPMPYGAARQLEEWKWPPQSAELRYASASGSARASTVMPASIGSTTA